MTCVCGYGIPGDLGINRKFGCGSCSIHIATFSAWERQTRLHRESGHLSSHQNEASTGARCPLLWKSLWNDVTVGNLVAAGVALTLQLLVQGSSKHGCTGKMAIYQVIRMKLQVERGVLCVGGAYGMT
jgi:hypothetical protein